MSVSCPSCELILPVSVCECSYGSGCVLMPLGTWDRPTFCPWEFYVSLCLWNCFVHSDTACTYNNCTGRAELKSCKRCLWCQFSSKVARTETCQLALTSLSFCSQVRKGRRTSSPSSLKCCNPLIFPLKSGFPSKILYTVFFRTSFFFLIWRTGICCLVSIPSLYLIQGSELQMPTRVVVGSLMNEAYQKERWGLWHKEGRTSNSSQLQQITALYQDASWI